MVVFKVANYTIYLFIKNRIIGHITICKKKDILNI